MKMQKIICFLLVGLLTVSLFACGAQGETDTESHAVTAGDESGDEIAAGTEGSGDVSEPDKSQDDVSDHASDNASSEASGDVSADSDPDATEELALPDFSTMPLTAFFPEGNKYFYVGADAFGVIDSYVRGDYERIKTKYALDESVVLPGQAPQNIISDYRDYCITQVSAEPYTLDGKQVEKITVDASLLCIKEGQSGYFDFRLEFVNTPHAHSWKLIRLDVQNGSKPFGDSDIPLTDPMTVQDFLASYECRALQASAFNFINAYFDGDYEVARQMFIAPSWALERPESWNSRSRDEYTGYGISWVSFEPYELGGVQVQGARFYLSMYRAVPGEEGVCDPLLKFVYVDGLWKVLELDFDA